MKHLEKWLLSNVPYQKSHYDVKPEDKQYISIQPLNGKTLLPKDVYVVSVSIDYLVYNLLFAMNMLRYSMWMKDYKPSIYAIWNDYIYRPYCMFNHKQIAKSQYPRFVSIFII